MVRSGLDLTRRRITCTGKLSDPNGTVILFDLLNIRLRTKRTVKHTQKMMGLHYVRMQQKRTFTLAIVQASAHHSKTLACAGCARIDRAARRICDAGKL